MSGILSPHPTLRRGTTPRTARVRSRSGIITRGGQPDPLDGIPFRLRLQTHRGEMSGTVHEILVTGAGDASVNGIYRMDGYFDGKPSFLHTTGNSRIIWFSNWTPEPVWLLNTISGPAYVTLTNTGMPSEEGWQDAGGGGSAPSIKVIAYSRLAPLGLYQDTACTIPATAGGDLIAAWRDETSGSGLVLTQSVSSNRPILRFVSGVPVLEFDGVDDFLSADLPETIQVPVGWAIGVLIAPESQEDSTVATISDDGMDWQSAAAYVFAQRNAATNAIRCRNNTDGFLNRAFSPDQWFVDSGLAEASKSISFINGESRQEVPRSNPIASTRFMIGAAISWSFGSYNMKGHMTSVALGPWTEDQTLQVQHHFKDLSPDPLAGIPFALRLQTHRGDGVPLGLYKDTACTIPATTEGDLIAAWRDEISGSGLVALQGVSTKRPKLQFISGKPVVRFDGVDDVLHTAILAPDDAFSYAASGRFRNTGNYPALIGSPPTGVTLGGYNGDNHVGINRLGVNDPQSPVDVGTAPFAFVAAYEPGIYSYHVRRPLVPDAVITDQPDGSTGYLASGYLMIGNGHNEEIAAAVDLASILILTGSRWLPGEMSSIAAHTHSLAP